MSEELDSLRLCVANDAIVLSKAVSELQMYRVLIPELIAWLETLRPLLDETNSPTVEALDELNVVISKLKEVCQ